MGSGEIASSRHLATFEPTLVGGSSRKALGSKLSTNKGSPNFSKTLDATSSCANRIQALRDLLDIYPDSSSTLGSFRPSFVLESLAQIECWPRPSPHKQGRDTVMYSQRKKRGRKRTLGLIIVFLPGCLIMVRPLYRVGSPLDRKKCMSQR